MAFVAESLGFDPEKPHGSIYNGFDSHGSLTARVRPVSGSESSWSSGIRGMAREAHEMAWTGHVVVAFPDPPSQGHIVDHWASELTSPVVNNIINTK